MSLRLLKPTMPGLRSSLPMLQHQAPAQIVERLRGKGLLLMRKRLLARSGSLCECPDCKAGYPLKLTWATMEADHVVPLYQGGDNSITNFRALHTTCHARITAQQAEERRLTGRVWSDDL